MEWLAGKILGFHLGSISDQIDTSYGVTLGKFLILPEVWSSDENPLSKFLVLLLLSCVDLDILPNVSGPQFWSLKGK